MSKRYLRSNENKNDTETVYDGQFSLKKIHGGRKVRLVEKPINQLVVQQVAPDSSFDMHTEDEQLPKSGKSKVFLFLFYLHDFYFISLL